MEITLEVKTDKIFSLLLPPWFLACISTGANRLNQGLQMFREVWGGGGMFILWKWNLREYWFKFFLTMIEWWFFQGKWLLVVKSHSKSLAQLAEPFKSHYFKVGEALEGPSDRVTDISACQQQLFLLHPCLRNNFSIFIEIFKTDYVPKQITGQKISA